MGVYFVKAKILNPKPDGSISFIPNGIIEFDTISGKICSIGAEARSRDKNKRVYDFKDYFLIPGLIDLHSHIPQLPGVSKNASELIPWLKNHIFPLEIKFDNHSYVRHIAEFFFTEALHFGTTCIVAYSSVHKEATDIVFEVANNIGIRAFIGKAMMDRDMNKYPLPLPHWRENIKDSLELARKWHGTDNGRLNYILLPRFGGSSSMKLLEKTSEVAQSENLFIQTHLSENRNEINYVKSLFPNCSTNTHIFKKSKLLGEKTLLVHCLHLSQFELQIIEETNSKIVHCPTSNIFLQSGYLPLRRYQSHNIEIGLGTDVAGGYSLSMFNEMKNAIETSKIVNLNAPNLKKNILTASEAFWMATLGNARILKMNNVIGSLEVGKDADFVLIKPNNKFAFYCNNENVENILLNLIYLPHTYSIEKVFIRGEEIVVNMDLTEIAKQSSHTQKN